MSESDLGVFLRQRREAITPAEVGLPTGLRRRTPGLRRSELAMLAGVSVEYLTRLEQGRDRQPSAQILTALADALRLSAADRYQLMLLAKAAGGEARLCSSSASPVRTVRPAVQRILHLLEPAPAAVFNRLNEIIAFTAGFEALAEPVGLLDSRSPSLARYVFSDPRAREVFPDWDLVADQQAANIKLESAGADPYAKALADELAVRAGAAFTMRLAKQHSLPWGSGVQRWLHPTAGELRLAYESLEFPVIDEQRLIVYLPADDATAAALDRLTGRRPGTLRAVV